MRAFTLAIALAVCAALAPNAANAAGLSMGYSARSLPKSVARAVGAPLGIEPLQMDGADALLRLANRRSRPIRGTLTLGRARTTVALKPNEARAVRLIAAGLKARPGIFTVSAPAAFRGRVGDAPWSWAGTLVIPNPVIPMSEREAPTVEMLFAASPFVDLNRAEQATGFRAWTPRNASARVQLLHDETGLILRFDVRDDVHRQTQTGAAIRREDSVEVTIRAGKRTHAFAYALTQSGPAAVRTAGTGNPGIVDARRDGDHTIYDIRIAWPDLAPLTGAPGERFPMTFAVTDADAPGPPGRLALKRALTWTLG